MPTFNHLHCHTQFSLLDGAASISDMVKKAKADDMKAVAITDHGNMFGAFKFVAEANKQGIKPIVGCEFYMVADRHRKNFTKEDKDVRCHQLLLAKNTEGYKNLAKLCSTGFIEGMYGKYPRIDKEILLKHHTGLIATTCCIGAEVPQAILNKSEKEAEEIFKWWLDLFGEDYYIELQRHKIPEQEKVNIVLLKFAKKYGVKIICSNDSHYVEKNDFNAHDILLCINTGELQKTPVWKGDDDEKKPKGYRWGFPNDQFYFKTMAEMGEIFHDLPEALDNTNEIVDKVDPINLKRDILLPNFPLPDGFSDQWEYLKHLTFEGARERYVEITPDIEERLNFELFTIKTMGFAGYFLIVADFIKAGRHMGVFVGPGRGSAAGSAVAYCIGITNIDPIKYNLLFERFLNPDRKSMPDIDTDFDDEGRQKVIDYVVDKYGKLQVAQIVTYSSMAAKMSIKDVARVLDLPLDQSNGLAKLVPDKPGTELSRVLKAPLDGENSLKEKEKLDSTDLENVKLLRQILEDKTDPRSSVLREAMVLEGSVRGTGVHAAGIIIAPDDLTGLMPVAVSKDSDLLLTQFDGKVIEDAGVIKMDFLGLKTLTIIKNTLNLIEKNHGRFIEIDEVDLTDAKTFEIFQKGETNGIFQFESVGMQKYMKELRPDKFDDIIAMNALYRPGPLDYIPNFIRRKHGQEEVKYDLADMEEYLRDTYGITVYQEQVMLLSQKLAGFTKGDADVLRKAMGKKDRKTLDKLKPQFIEKASEKGHDPKVLEKIWTDWEAFASYAFNKSHSTCYAFVAFQTAWLKAHYPSEYMAANLTNEKDNIEKVTYFLEEAKRMGLVVLGPDINESNMFFDTNKEGQIRFGLGGIKGVGDAAIQSIIEEREKNGPFTDIYNFVERVNLRTVNKKTMECLAQAGSFDCFEATHRAQFFHANPGEPTFIEKLTRYANAVVEAKSSSQVSLFGNGAGGGGQVSPPPLPNIEPWDDLNKLRLEKEVIGFYISGHPLDQYALDLQYFCTCTLDRIDEYKDKDVSLGGRVSLVNERVGKNGNKYALVTLEDYNGKLDIWLFNENYLKNAHFLVPGQFLYIKGRYQESKYRPGQTEFKLNSISLLSEVREKFCKCIKLNIPIDQVKPQFVKEMERIATENAGSVSLRFLIKEPETNISLELFSRKFKINPKNEFFQEIKNLSGIEYEILKQ